MRFLPAIVVFGAAGAGYLYTHGDIVKNMSPADWVSHESASRESAPADREKLAVAPREEVIAVPGPEINSFGDVFRFDLTPEAIAQKWSRVSTGLSDPSLSGYRVPLVTGTAATDLAGSLTYYFDGRPRLKRITFVGTTADPQKLVAFLAHAYGFKKYQSGNPRVTSYRVWFRYSGQLHITPAEVLDHHLASTNHRLELSLER
jgi:hypothetical protein